MYACGMRTAEQMAPVHAGRAAYKAAGGRLGRPPAVPPDLIEAITAAHAAGWTYGQIAARLNRERVATSHGGAHWYRSTVKAVCARANDRPPGAA
jgi:hypothetical protein